MKLSINGIRTVLNYDEFTVYTVVLENMNFYVNTVKKIISSLNGEEDAIQLFTAEKCLDVTKNIQLVDSVFNLDFSGTKLTNALYNHLKVKIQTGEIYTAYLDLSRVLTQFYDNVQELSDYKIDWKNDIDMLSVLKLANFKFVPEDDDNILNKILDYMHIYSDALGIKLFIFLNSKMLFDENKLKVLYEQCAKEGYKLLNLDCVNCSFVASGIEKILIVDNDLCEIL